jgi:hypothetical protein
MTVADDQLRPSQVAKLTTTRRLPADLVDEVLDSTPAELEAAAGVLADRTRRHLEQTGAIRPSASVLDLQHDQVQLLAAVYGIVGPWWAQPGYRQRPLGHMLKVVPTDVAQAVGQLLRLAGFLPPEEAGPTG